MSKSEATREIYSFRLPVTLMRALEAYCKKRGIKQTEVVEHMLRDFLGLPS